MAFLAPNVAGGEARGGSNPRQWGCDRRATKPQAKFGATRRAAGLFRPDFVARSSQIHCGICSSLTPRLGEKSLAANVIVFMTQTTQRFDIFARAASRILRSRSVRLWIPCADILSSIGSTSRLMNSAGGRSSTSLELSFRQTELLAERVVSGSRRG